MKIKNITKSHRLLLGIMVGVVLAVAVLASYATTAKAINLTLVYSFGGRVLGMIPCLCPTDIGKFIVAVGPPKPGVFIYDFRFAWLTTKMWWRVFVGNEVLGLASVITPGTCWQLNPAFIITGVLCIPTMVAPYIFLIGTSAIPPII